MYKTGFGGKKGYRGNFCVSTVDTKHDGFSGWPAPRLWALEGHLWTVFRNFEIANRSEDRDPSLSLCLSLPDNPSPYVIQSFVGSSDTSSCISHSKTTSRRIIWAAPTDWLTEKPPIGMPRPWPSPSKRTTECSPGWKPFFHTLCLHFGSGV